MRQRQIFYIRQDKKRPLHKKIAIHPVSFLLLLCVGVFLTVSTLGAHADTLEVSATVPAPLPTSPAYITWPTDQQHLQTQIITVVGTCPADSAYVRLDRNGIFSGVGQCVSGGFQIQTSLSVGANELRARVFNFTDNEGPTSPPITVFYDPPTPVQPPAPQPGVPTIPSVPVTPAPTQPGRAGLLVTADFSYQIHFVGVAFEWPIRISGGTTPYTITIDWRDGETSTITSAEAGEVILKHTYRKDGIFEPIIKVADQQGASALLQLMGVAKALPQLGTNTLSGLDQYLWLMWPAYIIVALMMASFWLGELEIVRKNQRRKRA
jgi:hypothetical protein